MENWITTITPLIAGESAFKVTFDWEEEIGVPGAFLIRNNHHSEFYLKSLTLEDVSGRGGPRQGGEMDDRPRPHLKIRPHLKKF